MTDKTGDAVIAQANDNGFLNVEPAVARGAVIALVGAVAAILVALGVLSEDQKQVLQDNAGVIAVAALTILPILQAVWTRFAVYSPKSTAEIAVGNANQPAGSPPTLAPPP